MNRLCNGSVIIVIHATLILHSNIRPHPWSIVQAVVSLNPSSVFFANVQEQDMSVHQTVYVCVCKSLSVSPLQLVNQRMTFMNHGISQWRTPHFSSCWIHPAVLETSKDIFISRGMAGNMVRLILVNLQVNLQEYKHSIPTCCTTLSSY